MIRPHASRVLLAVLVLLAGLATPDLVCAEHAERGSRAAESGRRTGGGEHHQHGPAEPAAPAAPGDPCERPDLPPCCPVLMSCTFALSAGAGAGLLGEADGSRTPLLRLSGVALSRITAPDPPPPRS